MRDMAVRMGDAMLRRILPQAVAGACVPQTGQVCKCVGCEPGGPCWAYVVTCGGQCVKGNFHCTR
jgi:hypothetical protein